VTGRPRRRWRSWCGGARGGALSGRRPHRHSRAAGVRAARRAAPSPANRGHRSRGSSRRGPRRSGAGGRRGSWPSGPRRRVIARPVPARSSGAAAAGVACPARRPRHPWSARRPWPSPGLPRCRDGSRGRKSGAPRRPPTSACGSPALPAPGSAPGRTPRSTASSSSRAPADARSPSGTTGRTDGRPPGRHL
jgi:hypothetical protein